MSGKLFPQSIYDLFLKNSAPEKPDKKTSWTNSIQEIRLVDGTAISPAEVTHFAENLFLVRDDVKREYLFIPYSAVLRVAVKPRD